MTSRLRALQVGATLAMMAAAVQAPTSGANSANDGLHGSSQVAAEDSRCELTPWTQYGSYISAPHPERAG